MTKEVRVRFAPSPTGPLHVGGLRTALYNYLFAKKMGGKFIIRIEDTDQLRLVEGAEEYILNSLKWLGLDYDEGPDKINYMYGPYRQSSRKEIGYYKIYIDSLIEKGFAYYAFDTEEELEVEREKQKSLGKSFSYNFITRKKMKNSLTLPANEVEDKIKRKEKYVIRFKVNEGEEIKFFDIIRGNISVNSSTLDDKVLMKSDGMPTYHFANIVDDYLMKITHVIRGEEWLPSTPFHILLYKSLNFKLPEFAHLSLILSPDGKGKLSKRDGDKYGFPVFPLSWEYFNGLENVKITGYKEEGYSQKALLNFLGLIESSSNLFDLEEIIEKFDLTRVSVSGSKFDINKLKNLNSLVIKNIKDEEILKMLEEKFPNLIDKSKIGEIINLIKEKSVLLNDITKEIEYFFLNPKVIIENEKYRNFFISFFEETNLEGLSGLDLKKLILDTIKEKNMSTGEILKPLRYSITGYDKGPELQKIFEILGPEVIISRIKNSMLL